MRKFTVLNNLLGWISFLIATTVYLLTLEPTTSLWDCSEFIASAYKLEVCHPPGAPLFLMMARFFSLFSGSPDKAAMFINALSAVTSGLTVMFLFWTITHLAGKFVPESSRLSAGNMIAILGSGFTGAMAFTFSDTFWFSAVEAETYATSSLFTAMVFWAILKWENIAGRKHANSWIILIAYLMGLSIGIHLLSLLVIPAIVLVYYFRKYKPTTRGVIAALALSVTFLFVMMYLIIQGFVKLASLFELFFVNTVGMPYNSGLLFYGLVVTGLIIYGIRYTHRKNMPVMNTAIVALTVIIIGYSSYAMIMIRSLANPPMDENNPETVFSLQAYLNREQYGDRPLFKGHYFNAPITGTQQGRPVYGRKEGKYQVVTRKMSYIYDERFTTIFPRMYSSDPEHVEVYKSWVDIDGTPVRVTNNQGEAEMVKKPSFSDDLAFFFKYQIGHMYLRYFMWNFAGRQNDIQGHGELLNGNWLSGIDFLDEARLGPQDNLPSRYENHKARNTYFLLPLLLGLVGLFFHFKRDNHNFWVVLTLFLMTGVAIVVYLNQTPNQPRERDYAYAGSFYAFCIWIGIGVYALVESMPRKIPGFINALLVVPASLILVPALMARENWDDHDRSGRYTARDFAYNYLQTCSPGAILFTNGDNDTFPLWYAQETEEIRTDVRVVNLMLFNTPWYIGQMTRKAYESEPLPISLPKEKYQDGTNNIIYMFDRIKSHVDLDQIVEFIASDNPRSKFNPQADMTLDYIPTKLLRLPVDRKKVIENGLVRAEDSALILPAIEWKINRSSMLKNGMMQLDLLATSDWERPFYFVAAGNEGSLNLEPYFQLDGFAYKLVPIKTPGRNFLTYGRINTDILYDKMMNEFRWGRMNEPDVYLDYYNLRTIQVLRLRNNFTRLANKLIEEGDALRARKVLDRCMDLMPGHKVPYDIFIPPIAEAYYHCEAKAIADSIVEDHFDRLNEELDYYLSLKPEFASTVDYETRRALQILQDYRTIAKEANRTELAGRIEEQFSRFYRIYSQKRQGKQ